VGDIMGAGGITSLLHRCTRNVREVWRGKHRTLNMNRGGGIMGEGD